MIRPTPLEAFDAMYTIAADNGRGEALFGDSMWLAHAAYERTLIGDGYPSAYLEFPLMGEPCIDILSVHSDVKPGDRFAPGAGFGHQAMYDWFANTHEERDHISCGLELDLSCGETETAGVYLQQREHTRYVEPFLASVGEQERAKSYLTVMERMPEGWPPSYVGLFPGRSGTPLRIGGYLHTETSKRCGEDPAYLVACFDKIGFSHYNADMLERCATFMRLAPSVDFQFDIMVDGSLGPTFGLSLSFNETMPREAQECMKSGYGSKIMRLFEEWGLADERWRLIADAAFARHVAFTRDDGSEGRFALAIRFNYAKVKFVHGEPTAAKFYLVLSAGELEV